MNIKMKKSAILALAFTLLAYSSTFAVNSESSALSPGAPTEPETLFVESEDYPSEPESLLFESQSEPTEPASEYAEKSSEAFSEPTEAAEISSETASEPESSPSEPSSDSESEPSEPSEPESSPYAVDPISFEDVSEPDIAFEWINLYVDSSLAVTKSRVLRINEKIYLPVYEAASLLGFDASPEEKDAYNTTFVSLSSAGKTLLVFANSRFGFLNAEKIETDGVSYLTDGVLYSPASIFSSVFDITCEEKNEGENADFYISSPATKAQLTYEKVVNSRGIKSQTDYLIWVSKANFSVRLFKKSPGGWKFAAEFPCAIGAPGTPTCEGIYKFYQRGDAWRYSTYYVGPIMRFNGGYALHSTLVNYNGTFRDNRVGVRISHGCVRLHPEDIQYLFNTVPLYTTVYITAE